MRSRGTRAGWSGYKGHDLQQLHSSCGTRARAYQLEVLSGSSACGAPPRNGPSRCARSSRVYATAGDVVSRPHSLLPAPAAATHFFRVARFQLTSHCERPWRTRTAGERARRRSRRYLGEPQSPRGCREPVPGARARDGTWEFKSPAAGKGLNEEAYTHSAGL